jgi:small ubiquitin-related modifier
MADEDVKPDVSQLNIKVSPLRAAARARAAHAAPVPAQVVAQDGAEVHFKIKDSTLMKKVIDSYCQRQGLTANAVRFLFDGDRVRGEQTPKDIGLEDGVRSTRRRTRPLFTEPLPRRRLARRGGGADWRRALTGNFDVLGCAEDYRACGPAPRHTREPPRAVAQHEGL